MKYIILSILSLFIFTSCTNKNTSIEKKNTNINHLHGSIKLKNGTVLAHNKISYKLIVKNSISNEDFISLKENLNGIGNLTYKKFETAKKRFDKKEVVLSYILSKEDIEKINKIVSKYENVIKNKTLYTQVSGYIRVYPRADFLSPFIGRIFKTDSSRSGRNGLEKYYNKQLENNKDIILNMNLDNLVNLEKEVDKLKEDLNAYEVSSIVLDLDSGYVDSIASSNRYNPMSIRADDIPSLTPSINTFIFNVDFLFEPFKTVLSKNIANKNELVEQLVYLKDLFDDLDKKLTYERLIASKTGDLVKGKFKLNFMQLVKAYSIFYNEGILKDFKLTNQETISQKQVISKELANKIKNTLVELYKSIENKKVVLEFKDHKKIASVKFKYFEENDKRYLKTYFIIEK
jgi:cell division protein FtsI/penicillin-binding protein 2